MIWQVQNYYWLNALLAISVIGVLVWGVIPAGFAFMIGVGIALPLNYPKVQDQMARIKDHAPGGILMATIILAAGYVFRDFEWNRYVEFNRHRSCYGSAGIHRPLFAYYHRCVRCSF